MNKLKKEIISIGKKLYELRLVAAKGGNLSARIDQDNIVITSSGTCLGQLKESDILEVNLASADQVKGLTTEFPLHSLIYQNFPVMRIIHCHPPLTNAYFAVYSKLASITFENKLFLGEVPLINQETPSIAQPQKVIAALATNNIAVIRKHGIVCMGDEFSSVFYLIEELEEAAKMAGFARLLSRDKLNLFEQELKTNLTITAKAYPMFSKQHILAIVDLINHDQDFSKKANELNLDTQVVIKLNEGNKVYKFNFQDGKIPKVDYTEDAPFVISGPADVWRLIFLGKLDPFVATTQGKLKLKGDLGKLSRWYVPFTRMFALFTKVGIK